MTTGAEFAALAARAHTRGITVIETAKDEFVVTMRGAFAMVDGMPDLRAQLERMGVRVSATPGTWRDYEARKREWSCNNPGATAEQYHAAMRRIADELGV